MEIKEHLKIYQRVKWFILGFASLVAVASFLYVQYQPTEYKIAVSLDVQFVNRPTPADYQYGLYYDLKGAEMFTQHLMSLLMTPAVIGEIYTTAGQGYHVDNLDRFTNRFKTKQYSAQNFIVTFTDGNASQGEEIGRAVGQVITQKAAEAIMDPNGKSQFAVAASQPISVAQDYNPWIAAGLGLILGLIFSLTLVYLKEYFKE